MAQQKKGIPERCNLVFELALSDRSSLIWAPHMRRYKKTPIRYWDNIDAIYGPVSRSDVYSDGSRLKEHFTSKGVEEDYIISMLWSCQAGLNNEFYRQIDISI